MDTSTTHWPQGIGVVKPTMDQTNISKHQQNVLERRTRPQKDQALNCPRCNSTNTKFCYYNNYSLTQPRYFCKTCRRYWTEGGSLRNVPVGGGSRKNKRSSSSAPSASSSSLPSKQVSDNHLVPPSLNFPLAQSASQNPKIHQGQDLNLAYPPTSSTTTTHDHHDHHHHHQNSIATSFLEVPYNHNNKISLSSHTQNPNGTTTTSSSTSAMELLKTTGLMSSFIAMPVNPDHSNTIFSTGFSNLAQEFKPSLSFGLDHYNDQNSHQGYNGNNNIHGVQESTAIGERLLFPSEDLKQVSSTTTSTDHHQFELNKGQGDNISNIGYNWNGMLGHGGSW